MPVSVHLRNGQIAELQSAKSCSWSPANPRQVGNDASQRWLFCRNDRGDVIATYREPDILGFQTKPKQQLPRFHFPVWRGKFAK